MIWAHFKNENETKEDTQVEDHHQDGNNTLGKMLHRKNKEGK
jgi:hypothetical protein